MNSGLHAAVLFLLFDACNYKRVNASIRWQGNARVEYYLYEQ